VAETDLKQIQRNTSLSFFEDGLWDLLLGIFLLAWGIGVATDTAAFTGVWFIVTYPIVLGLKKRLTYPRIGYVKLKQTERRFRQLFIAGVFTLLLAVFAYVLIRSDATPGWLMGNFDFIFGAVFAALALVVGYWWWVKRWFVYGSIILAASAAQNWLGWPFEWAFFISGGLITATGAVVLVRFLRRYPKIDVEDGLDAG
jgi:hypothetical protein